MNKYVLPAYERANANVASNADSSILLCDYILRLTKDIDNVDSFENKVRMLKIQAVTNKGDKANALELTNQYLNDYKDDASQALFNFQLGDLHYDLGQYSEAVQFTQKGLILFRKLNDSSAIASCLNLLGLTLIEIGQLKEAEHAFFEAMSIYDAKKELGLYGSVLQNIGNLYIDLENNEKAKEYYLKALAIKLKLNDFVGIASISNNMGIIYRYTKPDSAIYYYTSMPKPNGDNDILKHYIKGKFNLANIYKDRGQLDSAFLIFKTVEQLCIENSISQGIPRVLYSYGDIAYERGNVKEAIRYLDDALAWCDSLKAITLKKEMVKRKIEIYTETKQYKEALLAQQAYNVIADSIKINESKESMKLMEQTNKDKLDLLNKLEVQKQSAESAKHWKWFGIFIGTVFVSFLSIYLLSRRKK
ncbi:MAG: tetratricopeptide repeat protein [Chitinophagaceae bacterium]